MSFKLDNPPYVIDNTPLYHTRLEDGVLGKALNNGSILINEDIKDPIQYKQVLAHEMGHMHQIKNVDRYFLFLNQVKLVFLIMAGLY